MKQVEINPDFKELEPYLVGNPKQFIIYQGEYYCIRKECNDCPYFNKDCEFEEESIQVGAIEHPRRGIAFEKRNFLILRLKEGLNFEIDVPKELWDSPYSNLCLNEINVHYILSDSKLKFKVMKGQFRYYGTKEEFESSEYEKYFIVFNEYKPKHLIMAMDLSAIEPRVSTIASREPKWIEIFKGTSKVVVKEIELKEVKENDS